MPEPIPTVFDHGDRTGDRAPAPVIANEARALVVMRQVTLAMAAGGALLWGVWATHTILGLRNTSQHLVKVELAELVREFVQREARAGEPAEEITTRTASFLKALNTAVGTRARHGDIVLLGNAVVDGDIPDITATVRADVYAHQPPAPEPAHVPTEAKPEPVKPQESEVGHGQSH